jgi:transcriptional regulator with XRE-family HTH domain
MHSVALEAGVDPSHLSKVMRQASYKTPSAALAEKVARALNLPSDYFPEYREAVLLARMKSDPELRDSLFDELGLGEQTPSGRR